jgi:hypothetical protein
VTSSPFMTANQAREVADEKASMASTEMGERAPNGRYKMPATLPGDAAPKSIKGADWVSGGLQSMTNLAGSISDTKALGNWDRQQSLIGLGLHPELAAELRRIVYAAREAGVKFQELREHPEFRDQLDAVAERAKDIGGANAARDAGIAAHAEWETRPASGAPGSALFSESFTKLDALLLKHGLRRTPMRERSVRNLKVGAAGRFDDILLEIRTDRLLMADLKTKKKPFWSFLEIDAQLAGYASAEWMFNPASWPDGGGYVPGPLHHVDQQEGVVLHMPSDGGEPRLRRANLVVGLETLKLARAVCTQRSLGRSARHLAESYWPEISPAS